MSVAKKQYWEKLKDPKWQKKRLEVLSHYEFTCQSCFDSETTLHVHHKEYFKDHEPWEYDLNQMTVLCESCHESFHCFDFLKWVCSYADMDGPRGRDDISFLLGGFIGIPYEGLISVSCKNDSEYFRRLYSLGVNADNARWEKEIGKNTNNQA